MSFQLDRSQNHQSQLEIALQDDELDLHVLLAAIDDVIVVVDRDGTNLKIISTNSSSLAYPPEEIAGKSLSDLFPPSQVELFLSCNHQALVTGQTQICEYSLLIDHTELWFQAKCSPLTAETLVWVTRDISERKLAVAQLAEQSILRKQAETALQRMVEGTTATTGEDFFPAMVKYITEALNVSYALVTELEEQSLRVLAFAANGELQPTFSFDYANTPCERAWRDGLFYCERFVQARFPAHLDLVQMEAQSYLGVGLRDSQGRPIGSLCILDQQVIPDIERVENLLNVFAARAGAELERERATTALEQLNQELERKVAARTAELQASQAKFHRLAENVPGMIYRYIVHADGSDRFTYVSPQSRDIYEREPEEFIQDTTVLWSMVHPDDLELIKTATIVAVRDLRPLFIEHRIVMPTSDIKWVQIIARPEQQENGEIIWDGVAIDITESKCAEVIRKQAEAKINQQMAAIEAAIDGIAIVQDRKIVYVNQAHLDLFGYSDATELVGKPRHIFHSPVELAKLDHEVTLALKQNGFWQGESIAIRKDGSTFTQDLSLTRTADNVTIGVCRDITERKLIEHNIRQQAERETLLRVITQRIRQSLDINTIFDTACDEIREVLQADRVGVFKFYPDSDFDDGEFVAESVVAEFPSVMSIRVHDHCFGNNYSNLYAKGRFYVCDDIYHNGHTSCHTDILAQFAIRANLVMPLTCGDRLWGLLCIHQCATTRQWQQSEIDFSNQIANQIAIAIQQTDLVKKLQTELSERQQTQQLLIERNEELARATRLKDEFLANMSHELRTPLNAILGLTEGLQEEVFGSINPAQMKHLQTIEQSGSHLLELINDILDVAKIESGQLELDCNFTDITMLCSSSMAFIKQQALKKRIQIETKISHNLPELSVDERRIRQVLINLLNNAVKFTPEGGRITLQVSYHQEPIIDSSQLQGITRINIYPTQTDLQLDLDRQKEQMKVREYLKIAIIDTGIGIAPEHIHRLFQPFVQIDSTLNRQYDGTGLGLALVKRIVELHGGQVGLTSEIGRGSCFSIKLPCTTTDRSSPELATLSSPSLEQNNPSQQPQIASGLILLAEDNEANISTISSYLEVKGYRLLIAKNGREAIDIAQSTRPDLILMDIQMPGMDGLEAMQQIRLNPDLVDVPIIALTALAMTADRERCLSAGANEYISKPIKLRQLVMMIQQRLSR